jgi:tRNA dimethylallyltransferase
MKKLLFIVGPTASGKTAFAIEAAKLLNSEVISADSMQIYRKLNVGTAKATVREMQGVVHRMLDIVEPSKEFSVAEYRAQVESHIGRLVAENKTPVICGGTGLYVNSIIYPLNFSNAVKDDALRAELMCELTAKGAAYMHEKLKKLDAASAEKIHENDVKRVIRALEINLKSGKRVETEIQKPEIDYLMIGFNPSPRAVLYDRINARVDKMFDDGLIAEVTGLLQDGTVNFRSQSFQAIGYKEFEPYFSGRADLNSVKEAIKKDTRNYAKRQLTWFRRYENIKWFDAPCDEALELVKTTFMR